MPSASKARWSCAKRTKKPSTPRPACSGAPRSDPDHSPLPEIGSMPFVIVGGLLVALKLFEVGPVGGWPWWGVAAPLVIALLWWRYADASGLNKRREVA